MIKKSKFTEEQIAFALRQAETGTRVDEICRKFGVSQATFYNWKKKYGGLGLGELRRLKQLETENAQLKKMVGRQVIQIGKLGINSTRVIGSCSDSPPLISIRGSIQTRLRD